jgi:hypothetical protein
LQLQTQKAQCGCIGLLPAVESGRVERLPEEPKDMTTVVSAAVLPAIRQTVSRDQMEGPDLIAEAADTEVWGHGHGIDACFFCELTNGSRGGRFTWLNCAFNELSAGERMLKCQHLDADAKANNDWTGFESGHAASLAMVRFAAYWRAWWAVLPELRRNLNVNE